jgi:hypothetical protein
MWLAIDCLTHGEARKLEVPHQAHASVTVRTDTYAGHVCGGGGGRGGREGSSTALIGGVGSQVYTALTNMGSPGD